MKKIIAILIMISIICLLSSCGLELNGIDKYSPHNSEISLSLYLLPNENFVEEYEYENGDYFYFDTGLELFPEHALERELLYLQYGEKEYLEAKKYSIDNFKLSDINAFSHNGYNFFENIKYATAEGELDINGENSKFPYRFNMFAFNDEKRILVFMGFYVYKPSDKDKQILTFESIELFLKEYYSFYNFE